MGRQVDFQSGSVDVDEVSAHSFGFLLVLLFFIVPPSQHEHIVVLGLGLLAVAVDDSCDFLVQDSIVDVGFFGVEVFIKRRSDHAVRVDLNSELLCHFAYV